MNEGVSVGVGYKAKRVEVFDSYLCQFDANKKKEHNIDKFCESVIKKRSTNCVNNKQNDSFKRQMIEFK